MDSNESGNRQTDSEPAGDFQGKNYFLANSKKEISFRNAIENAIPSGIAVIDDRGKQIYANNAFCKMVGWSEAELLGQVPPYVYWARQDIGNINHAFEQTLNNNARKGGYDLLFCHKNGNLIPVNVIISSFVQENDRIFWLANVIDLTERKKEEEELKHSRLLLRSSMESQQGTIIFAIDRNYKYLFFNKAHCDSMKFAYNSEVETGMNILGSITREADRKLAKENYDRALKGESYSTIQTFGEANRAYYESFFNPIIDEKGEIIGCTGLARNITERKQAELALKESETKLKEIINQINDGIVVFDEKGEVIIWNKGAEQICGLSADAILNQNIVDLYLKFIPEKLQDRSRIEKEIQEIVSMQKPEIFNEIIDNEMTPLNSNVVKNTQRKVFPIILDGCNLFCMVFRDSTEIKRYEKELLRISSDKDKFYSAIAQYMYTPLSTFNNFAKVMAVEMDTLPIKDLQKMAAMMSKSATNLYSLLDNLLQWTKMNQGNIAFRPEKLCLIKTSQDALTILKANADLKNVKINHLLTEDVTVFADSFMIKTILRNLVSNAIKFTADNGQIDISARQALTDVTISVLDHMSGLSPDNLNKVFSSSEIHTALDTAEEKGTTLGLLLCKQFIEKHGGKIWVENAHGCEIKFTLPSMNT